MDIQWLIILGGYLLGALNFAFFAGYLLKGIDLREYGSNNLGATNTRRVLGLVPGVVVLILDVAKGSVAVWLASLVQSPDQWWLPLATGLAAIAGHNWPFYLSFKGGKGVATALGAMLVLYWLPLLLALLIGVALIASTRYVSLGSMVGAIFVPIFVVLFNQEFAVEFWFSLFVAILVIVRHHSNIKKLLNGTENKLSFDKS